MLSEQIIFWSIRTLAVLLLIFGLFMLMASSLWFFIPLVLAWLLYQGSEMNRRMIQIYRQ